MANKSGVIRTIMEGFAESTRTVHEINKEHMASVKADSKALFEEAKKPDPGLERFKEAKSFGNKVKVVVENIKESASEASEIERERRADIQSHEAYRAILNGSGTGIQTIVNQAIGRQTKHNPLSRVPFSY
jgi:hypothetical protein